MGWCSSWNQLTIEPITMTDTMIVVSGKRPESSCAQSPATMLNAVASRIDAHQRLASISPLLISWSCRFTVFTVVSPCLVALSDSMV